VAKEPPKTRSISMDPDGLARAAADGDNPIQIGGWSAQGAERCLETLEFKIEGWPDPLPSFDFVEVAPGRGRKVKRKRPIQHPWKKATEDDIKAMQAGVKDCRKLLDDLRILGKARWTPIRNVGAMSRLIVKIDKAMRSLVLLEDSITTQRPYAKIQKRQRESQVGLTEKSAESRSGDLGELIPEAMRYWDNYYKYKTDGVEDKVGAADRATARKFIRSVRTIQRWRKKGGI